MTRCVSLLASLFLVFAYGCAKPADPAAPSANSGPATPVANQEPPLVARQEAARPKPARRFTGTLRGGVIAIGAETTGWALETDDRGRIDVDVSKVREAAEKLDGQRVAIEGEMVTANWVERGEKQLLVADLIEPAE